MTGAMEQVITPLTQEHQAELLADLANSNG